MASEHKHKLMQSFVTFLKKITVSWWRPKYTIMTDRTSRVYIKSNIKTQQDMITPYSGIHKTFIPTVES